MTPRNRALVLVSACCACLLIVAQVTSRAQQSPADLEQLVAPIALYPDGLVAEILAAATYPADVDAAAHWLQQNASLSSDQLARAVDAMDWDSSVKALTEFPVVLANMGQNLAWTSALGDAYYNQPDDVMDAIQALRERALRAGTLQSNAQVTVRDQNGVIAIDPTDTNAIYVPSYDCWTVYGAPIAPWPGFDFFRGLSGGPRVVWSLRFQIGGPWSRMNWGWQSWGFDWSRHRVAFQRRDYVSRSPTVIDRHYAPRAVAPGRGGRSEVRGDESRQGGAPPRGATAVPRPGATGSRGREDQPAPPPKAVAPPKQQVDPRNDRGFPAAKPRAPETGTHAGALNGFNHGGVVSSSSDRGKTSLGVHPVAPPPPPPARSSPPPPPPARPSSPPPPPQKAGGEKGKGR